LNYVFNLCANIILKKNKDIVLFVVLITVFVILINQLIWLVNMYQAYQKEMIFSLASCTEKAIHMELSNRLNKLDAPMTVRFAPFDISKSGPKIKRTIQTEDTSFVVEYDINDPNVDNKVLQYFFIKDNPTDINLINNYLQACLKEKRCEIDGSYIEYYDLQSKKRLKHNKARKWLPASVISTDTIPLDILKLVGVKAFVATSPRPILKKMGYQMGLSLVLFLFASYSLVFLLRTILQQRKLEKMRQDFVNAMVHEFKRPITNASTMLELAPDYMKMGEQKKAEAYISESLKEFQKLTAYTDRIQRISNDDKEKIVLERTSVPLIPFFERFKIGYPESRNKTVNISVSYKTMRENLYVDILHFSNVMDNLIENAIKYSDNPVNILIDISDIGSGLEIKVIDDGFGIPDRDKSSIFDKFYRGIPKQGHKIAGFGLGLTYVKAIVEAHLGTIRVIDAPNKGSIFVLNLPANHEKKAVTD